MSSFLSNKYLRYRAVMRGAIPDIDANVACEHCGYNLRGLARGRNCPECGRVIPFNQAISDPLACGWPGERRALAFGLTMMAIAAAATGLARLCLALPWALFRSEPPLWLAPSLMLAIAGMWAAGAMMALPSRLDAGRLHRRCVRIIARWCQIIWPAAACLWLLARTMFRFAAQQGALEMWAGAGAAAGAIAAIAAAYVLHQAADDAELDDGPRRIGVAIYVVPLLSAVLIFVPMSMPFFMLGLLSPLLLAWCWYLLQFARGVWEIRQHVAWSLWLGEGEHDREGRIAETRAELDREVKRQVRSPIPAPHAPPTSPQRRRAGRP